MGCRRRLDLALAVDSGQRLALKDLRPAERRYLKQLATERQRRHFMLGRLAARAAVREHVGPGRQNSHIEIRNEPERAPRVWVDGERDLISISISHSSRLAVACVWSNGDPSLRSAGVDIEHTRPNEVSQSLYAFSSRERRLIARLPQGPEIAGLAAWTVKEAVWKALCAPQSVGPDAIDIYALSLDDGCATVRVKGWLAEQLGDAHLQVQAGLVEGPDGRYVLSLAQVEARS